jgi:hypothetical protein
MKGEIYLAAALILLMVIVGYYYFEELGLSPSFIVTSEPECNDGFDNDGDDEADFPADSECFALWDISESLGGRCDEDWSCTQWSACNEGKQIRTCLDANECGTIERKPLIRRECGGVLEEPESGDDGSFYLIIAGLIVLILIIFLIVNKVVAGRDKEKVKGSRKVLMERLKRKKKVYVGSG